MVILIFNLAGVNVIMNKKMIDEIVKDCCHLYVTQRGFELARKAVVEAFCCGYDSDSDFLDTHVVIQNLNEDYCTDNYPKFVVVEREYAELVAMALQAKSFSSYYNHCYNDFVDEYDGDHDIGVFEERFLLSTEPQYYYYSDDFPSVREFREESNVDESLDCYFNRRVKDNLSCASSHLVIQGDSN